MVNPGMFFTHQGDSISPYLYMICAEGLSLILNEAKTSFRIRGVRVARGSHSINHLFFADDSIMFCQATTREWEKIWSLLKVYEDASGQGINKSKTKIFFSSNTNRVLRNRFFTLAGVSSCNNQEQYLGLSIMIGANKICTFEGIRPFKSKIRFETGLAIRKMHFSPKPKKKCC